MEKALNGSEKSLVHFSLFSLLLILVSNICFYTVETIMIYGILSGFGILLALGNGFKHFKLREIKINSCFVWICSVYIMYIFYGIFFLRTGTFIVTTMIFRFLECLSLCISFYIIIKKRYKLLGIPFIVSGITAIIVLIVQEGGVIIAGGERIGDSLSGNVNTVGFNLGIIATIVIWLYCINNKKSHLALFCLFATFTILTGSKKALLIIMIDLTIVLVYKKNRASTWLKLGMILLCALYAIFNVPNLYNIIGIRIESMYYTLFFHSNGEHYSYSTDMRQRMIHEGVAFFEEHPIFGGGYNYFMLRTSTKYEYSHCNYIEMLCSFGILGTLLYYSKHIFCIRHLIKLKNTVTSFNKDLFRLACALLIISIILDWGVVTFSAQVIWYVPIIIASSSIENMIED